jgi:hypothetical protein
MVSWFHHFGPEARQNIMVVGAYGGDYSPHGSQEAKRDRKEGTRSQYPQLLPPTRLHPPNVSTASQHRHLLGNRPSTHEPLGETVKIQTFNTLPS